MNDPRMGETPLQPLSRRRFLRLGTGLAMSVGGVGLLPKAVLGPRRHGGPVAAAGPQVNVTLVGTDGWIALPEPAHPTPWFPDPYAPAGRTTYVFGFRDVSGFADADIQAQRGKAQTSAPLLSFDEGAAVTITVRNLGLPQRPDLTDGHTIHWHGFRNAASIFDGVPEVSIAVPVGREFPYFYHPRDPGTYIYHCHFEDVEHVQMGMTGIVFVRPAQNTSTHKFVYNDGDGSTEYDREFAVLTTDMWLESHYQDAHIQQPDWSDYRPDAYLLNGRSYPDTLEENGSYDANGNPLPPQPRLAYQPLSALVRGNAGEKVLVRLANLGYQEHSIALEGLTFRVVGKDAVLLRGRDTTDLSYETNTLDIGPGESVDAIIGAPSSAGASGTDSKGAYDAYALYDRAYGNGYRIAGSDRQAGQRTEVRIYAAGTLPPQTRPNE